MQDLLMFLPVPDLRTPLRTFLHTLLRSYNPRWPLLVPRLVLPAAILIQKSAFFIHKRDIFIQKSAFYIHKRDVLIHKTDILIHKKDIFIHKMQVSSIKVTFSSKKQPNYMLLLHEIATPIHKTAEPHAFHPYGLA